MEARRLYRDILRAARRFTWKNEKGESWRNVLEVQVRKEFEVARLERDPLIIAKMLLVGRDCLNQTLWKMDEKNREFVEKIDKTRT